MNNPSEPSSVSTRGRQRKRVQQAVHLDAAGPHTGRAEFADRVSRDQDTDHADSRWQAEATAVIVELLQRVAACRTEKAAVLEIANSLPPFLGCDQVALGFCRPGSHYVTRLEGISGAIEVDLRTDLSQKLQAALNEATTESVVGPANETGSVVQSSNQRARQKLAEFTGKSVASTVLQTRDGRTVGAWLALVEPSSGDAARIQAFLRAAAPGIAEVLQLVRQAGVNPFVNLWSRFAERAHAQYRRWVLGGVVLLVLTAIIPWPHNLRCDCRLTPVARRFVVTPFDGVLQESLVRPGDMVEADEPLARMDGQELAWEESALKADRQRLAKRRDIKRTERDIPAVQLAELEIERLDVKSRLLQHRQNHLVIKSPIEGIVLGGDLRDAEGAPIKTGQPLLEVAPLDRLRVEVEIPQDQLADVSERMEAIVWIEGVAAPLPGNIDRLRPETEIRSGRNVLVAEIVVENKDRTLRPGMCGKVKLIGKRRSMARLFWQRLRKACAAWS